MRTENERREANEKEVRQLRYDREFRLLKDQARVKWIDSGLIWEKIAEAVSAYRDDVELRFHEQYRDNEGEMRAKALDAALRDLPELSTSVDIRHVAPQRPGYLWSGEHTIITITVKWTIVEHV